MSSRVCLIGSRGPVSSAIQERLRDAGHSFTVLTTEQALAPSSQLEDAALEAEVAVLATLDFVSPAVVARLPSASRILDISPAFRTAPGWTYGLPEVVGELAISKADRVANPGCFATAAILLLAPLLGEAALLDAELPVQVTATGGYTTGGQSLISKAQEGLLSTEAVYGLSKPHRHVPEIRRATGLQGPLWMTPSIANYPKGIRVSIPLFGADLDAVESRFIEAYGGSQVKFMGRAPSRIEGNVWADRAGAGLWLAPQDGGVLAICALDNLRKGAVDSAMDNIELMLTGSVRPAESDQSGLDPMGHPPPLIFEAH